MKRLRLLIVIMLFGTLFVSAWDAAAKPLAVPPPPPCCGKETYNRAQSDVWVTSVNPYVGLTALQFPYYGWTVTRPQTVAQDVYFGTDGAYNGTGYRITDVTPTAWAFCAWTTDPAIAQFPCDQPVPDGVWYLRARAINAANEKSAWTTIFVLKKDATAPDLVLTGTPDGNNGWYKSALTQTRIDIAEALNTIGSAAYSLDGGAYQPLYPSGGQTYTETLPLTLTDGVHDLRVTTQDNVGNAREETTQIKVDTTAPGLSVSASGQDWHGTSSVPITVEATDGVSGLTAVTYSLDGGAPVPLSASGTSYNDTVNVDMGDGAHTLRVYAEDMAGWWTEQTITVNVDTQPPVITLNAAPDGENGWYKSVPASVGLAIEDTGIGLQSASYAVDGGGAQPLAVSGNTYNTPLSLTLEDGTHTITAEASDMFGKAASASETIQVDTTPPDITFTDIAWDETGIHITGTVTDALSGVQWLEVQTEDGGAWESVPLDGAGGFDYDLALDNEYGQRVIRLRAADNAGGLTVRTEQMERQRPIIPLAPVEEAVEQLLPIFRPAPTPTPLPTLAPTPLPPEPEPAAQVYAVEAPDKNALIATILPTVIAMHLPAEPPPQKQPSILPFALLVTGGLFYVFASNALIDRRPQELDKLAQIISKHRKEQ